MSKSEGVPLDRRAIGNIISQTTPSELSRWLQRHGATQIAGPEGPIGTVLSLPVKDASIVMRDAYVGSLVYKPNKSLLITENPHQAVVVEPLTALGLPANFSGHGEMRVTYKTSEEFVANLVPDYGAVPVEVVADNPGDPEYRTPFQRVVTDAVLNKNAS